MAPVGSHINEKLKFHNVCGSLVSLSNSNRTATRNHPHQEFNNGLIMSSEPLRDNQLFEVRIDRKIYAWSGSIEIGVTTLDPSCSPLPSSATNLRDGSWVMSGTSVLHDGRSILEEYGTDLDQLGEGDRVGVMRASNGDLHFFVNGVNEGVAASNVLSNIYAVVDLYGKCSQVTLMDSTEARILANDISNENLAATFLQSSHSSNHPCNDKLKFHERCGLLIDLSNNNQTAERKRPLDEFNNGVCMTNRPLKDDELFEIRIDELVNKWSGSIELGITTEKPDTLEFPATMTNMRSNGTIMMSGSGILTNGKGTRREYGEFNLDELHEGDRIGVVRKTNGNLHYFINGLDQGMASSGVPPVVYGVIDLYGMTIKVTIVDHSELSSPETLDHTNNDNMIDSLNSGIEECSINENEKLLFHPTHHGKNVAVINNGRTGHRPKALDDFNNAVLLTSRPLLPNETFEVVIERLVVKWAGSIEIGVTTHSPFDLEFPSTMTNMRSGTWMMTGNGVMYNGMTIVDEYGHSLDRLNVGDRVGVIRLQNGTLKFFVNGVDQGVAATNVPEKIFGVIDLYGQAAQASIVDHSITGLNQNNSPTSVPLSSSLTLGNDLRFHSIHGKNARVIHHGVTATRPNAQGEFNDAILMSHRPLKDNEMFEIIIEQMVDRWSGSIEAGVTTIPPDKLELPSTMTDLNHDTWMLSGSAVMQDGATVRNGYKCDLDQLRVGTRIGMMRHGDATLHYYVNGEDQGAACSDIPTGIYAVIDLYGQCAQVSIVQPSHYPASSSDSSALSPESLYINIPLPVSNEVGHHFHSCCGKNIMLRNNATTACRVRGSNNSLVFSATPLENEEIFEIQVEHLYTNWAGALQFGLTTYVPSAGSQQIPVSPQDLYNTCDVWLVVGTQILNNGTLIRDNYGPSLNRLSNGDRIGVKRSTAGNMHIFINGEDLGVVATNIQLKPYVILDIQGRTATVSICSMVAVVHSPVVESPEIVEELEASSKETIPYEFHDNHGSNIEFLNGNICARRTSGFNHGLIISNKPIIKNHLFQICINKLDSRWSSSLQVGLVGQTPEKLTLPLSAVCLRKSSWVISGDSVYHDGTKVKSRYGPNLDSLHLGHLVGILVDTENQLHLVVNGVDQGVAAKDLPEICYAFVDVYGQCEQVTLVESHSQACLPEVEHREKADKETGVREKIKKSLMYDQTLVRNCEYLNACRRLKTLLGFPDGYFQKDLIVCYCETCHKIRGDEPYFRKGDPPKDFALPFGWCRFALKLTTKAENSCVQDKWHVAFHGTKIGAVRRILDNGELLPIGQMGLGPFSKDIGKLQKDKDIESCQVCISPTLKYAGSSVFASRQPFVDPKTKKQLQARVAFQVFVRPGSYTVGPPRTGSGEPFDKHFSNSDLEWHTKERGATVLQSLLIKIEEL